jgi:hypothetical protein
VLTSTFWRVKKRTLKRDRQPDPTSGSAFIQAKTEACGSRISIMQTPSRQQKLRRGAIAWILAVLAVVRLTSAAGAGEPARQPSPADRGARVVAVSDPAATDAFRPRAERIRTMVDRGIKTFTGHTNVIDAWRSLLSTQDVVGIKVFSTPGATSGTRPAVVASVVEGLLAAGVPGSNIVIWDKQTTDLRLAGYFDLAEHYRVRIAGSTQAGYDEKTFYETALLGNLVWGDLEFGVKKEGVGRKSFVSQLVSRTLTKIINITPLLNNNLAGVAGNLYGLSMGSVDNLVRFEADSERMATAVPEIYALPALSDKVVLNITDALICQYEGNERSLLHYSTALNELRFSKDPVALDVLSLQDLERQRKTSEGPAANPNLELYSIAALLELGVNDLRQIHVETVKLAD